MSRASRAALVAVLLASSAAAAAPKGAAARAQFDKGVTAYTKGDYAAASAALGSSFVLEPDPETLFAWAQTERKLGHCDRAIELYTKLLKMDLPAENKEAVKVQIGECKDIIADEKKANATGPKPKIDAKPKTTEKKPAQTKVEPAPPPPVEPTPPPPVEQPIAQPPPPVESKPEGRTWWKDPVGGALVGAGAIGIGLGVVFLVQGRAADSDKANAMSYPEYETLANRAESRGRLGVISLVAGGALAAGGVVWYVTRKPQAEKTVTTLVVPGGGGVAFSGRF
ncbi:MAG TPA: hypothetical protein VFV99_22090 [Kofleriaceae bacterium]|nr:hypothetical protein [Kofleriaceae bacterium]